MKDILTGLDIGSTHIRVIVAQCTEARDLHIIGFADSPSEGVSKGVITSIEDAVSSISRTLERAERMVGIPIERVYVSISGSHIISQNSKGVIAVAKADGEIREEDVHRAIEAAQTVATPPNYEIIHVIPREYAVDSQKHIKDPIGMTGIRMEVETQIIQGLSVQIKNLTKTVYRTGVDVSDLVLTSLASGDAVLSKRQKELGVAVLNIGGTTTSLAVYEEGDIMHTSVIPIGSTHITSDIAIGLRTAIDTAEEIKLRYGVAVSKTVDKKEEIKLGDITKGESGIVSRKHISEIIEARVEEIFHLTDKELAEIDRSGKLPAGIVLTGGGAKLENIVALARNTFLLPASVGYPRDVSTSIDKINDPALACVVGLVLWGKRREESGGKRHALPHFSSIKEVSGKINKWFKSLLP